MSSAERKRMTAELEALQAGNPELFETTVRRMLKLGGRPSISEERTAFVLASWRVANARKPIGKEKWCMSQVNGDLNRLTAEALYRIESKTPIEAGGLLQVLKKANRKQRKDAEYRALVEAWEEWLSDPRGGIVLRDET